MCKLQLPGLVTNKPDLGRGVKSWCMRHERWLGSRLYMTLELFEFWNRGPVIEHHHSSLQSFLVSGLPRGPRGVISPQILLILMVLLTP